MITKSFQDYEDLLNKNYKDAVATLLVKYGRATDNYFKERSYQLFLNGEIKSPTKGQISRSAEGLYCHHIDENKFLNMANASYIFGQKIPFLYQQKDRLVYCNLVEHLILHALIVHETQGHFGYPGLIQYLKPSVKDWYISGIKPDKLWEQKCFKEAYITSGQATILLNTIDKRLVSTKRKKFSLVSKNKTTSSNHILSSDYPHLVKINFDIFSSRTKIVNKLFDLKYRDQYKNIKQFIHATPTHSKNELLKELDQVIEQLG
ncbi:hypothetical protein [Oenococcus oeni]|uniref:hypothetical protein n=1 Tax=Oenococcus oeni TaxID=1247 RepID=UPI00067BA236|nr:hypothetical protein [Oenococcus oeni]